MRRRDLATGGASIAALVCAIFAAGGAFRWVQALVAILVLLAVAPQFLSRRGFSRLSPLMLTFFVAIGLTALQLVPLPTALVEQLQPVGASLREDGAAIADIDPWSCLSLDPAGSLHALCFFTTLLGVAWLALRYAVTERGRYWLLAIVCGACALLAIVVGAHELVGAKSLYGIYTPNARPSVLGPLLNENNLGCLMAVGTTLAAGLAMYRRQPSWTRMMWIAVVLANGITTVASQSRGATLALVGGAAVTLGLRLGQRLFGDTGRGRTREFFVTTSLPIGIVIASTVAVIVYATAGGVSSQLDRTAIADAAQPTSKVAIWRASAKLIEDSPWTGVGRGAFEPAINRVHPTAAQHSFSHAENEYVQVIVDWGIPGALLFGVGLAWLAVRAFRRWRDGGLAAGALGAVAVVALQSVVDFGIELLGIAIPVTIVLATLSYVPVKELEAPRRLRARILRGALAAGLLLSTILLGTNATRTLEEDHEVLAGKPSMALIQDVLKRHPLDYYGYAKIAERLRAARDPRAVELLNHALRLHPTHAGLHHMAADLLYRAGQSDQAAVEYAIAIRGSSNRRALLDEVLQRFPRNVAARAIPTDIPYLEVILNPLIDLDARDVAIQWLGRILDRHPASVHVCERLYVFALDKSDLVAASLASQRCSDLALSHDSRVAVAKLLANHREFSQALNLLRDVEVWPVHVDTKMDGWLITCDIDEAQQHWDEAKRCLRRLDASGNVTDQRRMEVITRLERISDAIRAASSK